MLLASALAAVTASQSMQVLGAGPLDKSLSQLASAKGLFFGCAVEIQSLRDTDFAAAVQRESNMLVPSWEMKRDVIERYARKFEFGRTEKIREFARVAGMRFRGHTLAWYRANAPWLVSELQSNPDERLLTDYIDTVCTRFKNQVHSWDVVNEAVYPEDGRSD